MTKVAFSFKSQGTEKIELFSQQTDVNESLIIGDYGYIEIPVLLLDEKLLLKEGDYKILLLNQIH